MPALPGETLRTDRPDPFSGTRPVAAVAATAGRPAREQISEAAKELRGGLHQFVVAMKNMALYPPTSQTNIQGISQLRGWLAAYMAARGPISLTVTRDGLNNEAGEQVYLEKPNESILSYPLFRDGIQILTFEAGLTEEELKGFIGILLKFRTAGETDHEDVVTAMWDASFQGIRYIVADEYEEVDPEFDTGAMVCALPPSAERPDPDAPWSAEQPVQAEGTAPVAKSVGSLFALADSLDFSFAPGGAAGKVADPHEGGKLLPSKGQGPGSSGGAGGGGAVAGGAGGGGAGEASGEGGSGPYTRVVVSQDGEDSDDFDGLEGEDGLDDGGFGPMGGAAGAPRKAPEAGLDDDIGFHKDASGRVRRGADPASAGGAPAGGGNGADPDGDALENLQDGPAGSGGAGLGRYRGSGVGPGRGHGGEGGGEEGLEEEDDEGAEGQFTDESPYGPQGSIYDPDGDPDGHPVKGPPGSGAEGDGEGDDPWGGKGSGGSAFGEALQNMDFSGISLDSFDEGQDTGRTEAAGAEDEERPEIDEKLKEGREKRLKFWGLSAREIKQVNALLQWEEARAKTASILNLVTVLVKSPVLKPSMIPSLTQFVSEEISFAVSALSLAHVNAFFARLHELAAREGPLRPAGMLWASLTGGLASPGLMEALSAAVTDDAVCAEHYDSLRYFLYQLPQGSAAALTVAMTAAKSLAFKKLLVEILAWQLPSFQDSFASVAQSLNEWALTELLALLTAMRRPLPAGARACLIKHPSPLVREAAARQVLDTDPNSAQALAPLIIDPDQKVRSQVAPFLTRRRDPLVESVLRRFLEDRYGKRQGGSDLLEHYRRLGLTAGSASERFLSAVLLKRDLGSLFGAAKDYHRIGAALALMLQPQDSWAGEILRRASRSAFRAVRSACSEASRLMAAQVGESA
ncbi:MAG: HEAT repeat domain-containing protein [Deltaproteobacteria bacterium]|jgi:hypothetical protein|nr:HEAT repeat domain-containing protein [Deltaproteobacteria bacterium]